MRIPLMMALVVGLFSVIIDAYIYFDIRYATPGKPLWRRVYAVFSLLCWALIVTVVCLPYRSSGSNISGIMWALYTYITIYAAKCVYVICSLVGWMPLIFKHKHWSAAKWVGLPLALITFFSLWWGALVTRHHLQIVDVTFASERVPEAFDGFRIVQISDLHVGTWGEDTRFINRMVDSINSLHPDIILFTGDIVNRETTELSPFLSTLARLKAPYGVYSVLGNHDYGDYIDWPDRQAKEDNLQLLKEWQRQIGWRLLNNERADIVVAGDTIKLLGVENWGEPPFHQYGHLTDAYPISKDSIYNLNDRRFKILMTHNPEHWRREVSKISDIDLTLSGHTHAMQMVFGFGNWKWSPARFKYEEWGGLYTRDNNHGKPVYIYVNIGAGEVGMPFRIGGAVPEITAITLKRSSSEAGTQAKKVK